MKWLNCDQRDPKSELDLLRRGIESTIDEDEDENDRCLRERVQF